MISDRAWVLLPSGRRLDLLRPDPSAWTDSDLATGLSRTYRWGGYSRWDLPLSVAQHSLLVLALHERMRQPCTPSEALRELLHDAEEGLMGFDPISPLKPHLGAAFKSVTDRLRAAIDERYQLPAWDEAGHARHKQADRLAAASEAFHVTGWSRDDIRESLQITLEPLEDDPLTAPNDMQKWEPWPPRLAASRFLTRLRDLIREAGDLGSPASPSHPAQA